MTVEKCCATTALFKSSISGVLPYLWRSFCLWSGKVFLDSVPSLTGEICIICPGAALSVTAEHVVECWGWFLPQPGGRMWTWVTSAATGATDCRDLPRQEGPIDLHGSTAVELISAPCDPSIFLAGFKNRILHPHVHWKERSERAVHR